VLLPSSLMTARWVCLLVALAKNKYEYFRAVGRVSMARGGSRDELMQAFGAKSGR